MVIASIAEVLSIGAVIPFLAVLTSPQKIYQYESLQPILIYFDRSSPIDSLVILTLIFCSMAIVSALVRLTLLWATFRLSFSIGADLNAEIYRRTLYQPYEVHISRNSSELIDGISSKASSLLNVAILPILNLFSSLIILLMVLCSLLWLSPIVAIIVFGGFGFFYLLIAIVIKGRLRHNSKLIAKMSTDLIKCLQEGLGGIRDVLIDGNQAFYCNIFQSADVPLRRALAINQFITFSPRYLMEGAGIVLISLLALASAQDGAGGLSNQIPVLGALALGAQRLLPLLQQIFNAWSGIRGGQQSLADAVFLLDQPLPHPSNYKFSISCTFKKSIEICNISYSYPNMDWPAIRGVNLEIKKGSRLGIIGTTGSGKSTFLDLIMGLLVPTHGFFRVDGVLIDESNRRYWQGKIAHVPQFVYLADATIAENIAFGTPYGAIDFDRVRRATEQAQLADVVDRLPLGFDTHIGERGARLSGGQRQRIGVARALYKKSELIIFDEATSALDELTERQLMNAIHHLDPSLTILVIAHRLSTLVECDSIVEISEGAVSYGGSYEKILARAEERKLKNLKK